MMAASALEMLPMDSDTPMLTKLSSISIKNEILKLNTFLMY
jgi:hypothetical protein